MTDEPHGPRVFAPAALASVVRRTLIDLPQIPENAHVAFLSVANQDGIKAVVAIRVGGDWTVGSYVEVDKNAVGRKVTYGVEVHGFL